MPVKRRLSKQRPGAISDLAIALFEEMQQLYCSSASRNESEALLCKCDGCQRWWELHPHLRHALGEKLWNFPVISRLPPDRRHHWPPDSEQARWLELEAAAAARRQRATSKPESEPAPTPAPV
jgi:hypothetical protein